MITVKRGEASISAQFPASTVGQLKELIPSFIGIQDSDSVYVNDVLANNDTPIADNFVVEFRPEVAATIKVSFGFGNTIDVPYTPGMTIGAIRNLPEVRALGVASNDAARLEGYSASDSDTVSPNVTVSFEKIANTKG